MIGGKPAPLLRDGKMERHPSSLSTRLLVPVQRNLVSVVEESFLVWVVVVVDIRRVVEEKGGFVADGLGPLPVLTKDADNLLDVLADDGRVEFALHGESAPSS